MILAIAFAISVFEAPRYAFKTYVTSKDVGAYVEVASISANGNVATNNWYGDRFLGDDVANRPSPVLFIHGKSVVPKSLPEMVYALAINDCGQALFFRDWHNQTWVWDGGRLNEVRVTLRADQRFIPYRIGDDGTIFGAIYPLEGPQSVLGAIRMFKGKQEECSLNDLRALKEEHGGVPLKLAGLPEIQDWTLRQTTAGISLGYGIHTEAYDGPPNGLRYTQFGLLKCGDGIYSLKTQMDGNLADVTVEDGGLENENGVIAASGTYRGLPAIFVLKPTKVER